MTHSFGLKSFSVIVIALGLAACGGGGGGSGNDNTQTNRAPNVSAGADQTVREFSNAL